MKYIIPFIVVLFIAAATVAPDVATFQQRVYATITNTANDTTEFREPMTSNYQGTLFVKSDRTSGNTGFSVIIQTSPTKDGSIWAPVDTLTFAAADSVATKVSEIGRFTGVRYRMIIDGTSGTQVTDVEAVVVAKY